MSEGCPSQLLDLLRAATPAARNAAWERFVAHYSKLLLSVARRFDHDYDAVMDRYAFMLEQLRRDECRRLRAYAVNPGCRFTTWLVVVCRRLSVDYNRSRFGRVRPESDVIELRARRTLAQSLFSQPDLEALASPAALPDEIVEANEQQARLEHCLARLDASDRLLLKLRFEDDLPASEIARLLRLPTPFHVYRRINRLLADLRAALTLGGGPPGPQIHDARPLHHGK